MSEYLPYIIWYMLFLGAQGYTIEHNVLFQDNESAIKMETNGRNSCTGNSRHIEIKYFWVKDRVDKKEIKIQYCPTGLMLADYFTKALQGSLFVKFRNIIMGYSHIDEILCDESHPLKERVKNATLNRKMSEYESSPITRNEREKEKSDVSTKFSTYADVVKKSIEGKRMEDVDVVKKIIEEKRMEYSDATKKNTEGKDGSLRAICEEKLKRM